MLRQLKSLLWLVGGAIIFTTAAQAQSVQLPPARALIIAPVNDSRVVSLQGNTRPEVLTAIDSGPVPDSFPLNNIQLLMRRPAEREQAINRYFNDLVNPNSTNFHRWLTARQIASRFGLAQSDTATITNWLRAHGFHVNVVYPGGLIIDFSGTAGEVRNAFHTTIHRVRFNGVTHIANMVDPQIPAALVPAVVGFVSLSDFRGRPAHKSVPSYTIAKCAGGKTKCYDVTPADLATIYKFSPLFYEESNPITGIGETIALAEDSDISSADWNTFRTTFGLSGYRGTLVTTHPPPVPPYASCNPPGTTPDAGEATLDAEWASAAAPGAIIEVASCESDTTPGWLIAIENLVSSSSPPPIISLSYQECEYSNRFANSAYVTEYQLAAIEGISIFVAAGDEGAADCDLPLPGSSIQKYAQAGIAVNGYASTAFNVAVGGTDFTDTYDHSNSTYWRAKNSDYLGSAKTYIPEMPWNDSCASTLIANYFEESQITYGTSGFCNSVAGQPFLMITAGGGGPSNCYEIEFGNCAGGGPKPPWQAGFLGNPADNVRDLPDVSLFAANGIWGHAYITCFTGTDGGITYSCKGPPDSWWPVGGTSVAAPIWAGIQALIDQKAGVMQGDPAPVYYSLAAAEFGPTGNANCYSTASSSASAKCIFHDIVPLSSTGPAGDIDVDCEGENNCYFGAPPSGTYGVLSFSEADYQPAYAVTKGWDFATGLGTPNVENLVNHWSSTAAAAVTFKLKDVTFVDGTKATGYFTYNPSVLTPGYYSVSIKTPRSTYNGRCGGESWRLGCGGTGGYALWLNFLNPLSAASSDPILTQINLSGCQSYETPWVGNTDAGCIVAGSVVPVH